VRSNLSVLCDAGPICFSFTLSGFSDLEFSAVRRWCAAQSPTSGAQFVDLSIRLNGSPASVGGSAALEGVAVTRREDGALDVEVRPHSRSAYRHGAPMAFHVGVMAALAKCSEGSNWRIFHAAATSLDALRGLLIVGPSGQGKTTTVRSIGQPILGDEVIAISLDSMTVGRTAVPGAYRCPLTPPLPLAALVLPQRTERAPSAEAVPAAAAVKAVIKAMIRLPGADLQADLDFAARLVAARPTLQLCWDAARDSPWDLLDGALTA
jgi:hypothetical protein